MVFKFNLCLLVLHFERSISMKRVRNFMEICYPSNNLICAMTMTYQDGIFEAKDELHRGALRNGRSVGVYDKLYID